NNHAITEILKESLQHEKKQLDHLHDLLKLVEGQSVFLEEYAREMIVEEEAHIAEVEKMIRKPE
ncbi:MAG: ferritin-like domain-containing protein, partial [Bdellovibrio sp.]